MITIFQLLQLVGPATKYIDPASGSLIFQVIAGAFLAIGVTVRLWWRKITQFFKRSTEDV